MTASLASPAAPEAALNPRYDTVIRRRRTRSVRVGDIAIGSEHPVVVQSIFDLVRQLRTEGYTVLIVEQNIQQVLQVVDRAYLLETGRIRSSGDAKALLGSEAIRRAYLGLV